MKNIILLLTGLIVITSCTRVNNYVINGSVVDSTLNGTTAYLIDYSSDMKNIDSCVVVDGKFSFTGPIDSVSILRIELPRMFANVVPEKGTINVVAGRPSTVSGTPLNDLLDAYIKFKTANNKEYYAEYDSVYKAFSGDKNKLEEVSAFFIGCQKDSIENLLVRNISNNLGLFMVWEKFIVDELSLAQMDSIINVVGPTAEKFGPIYKLRNSKMNRENTAEGKKFIDFSGVNEKGDSAKLSDYVGKGNYVLVDFWASWCGPCRGEVPYLKDVYNEFKDKGLVLLGVNVWDTKENFEKAVVELEMPWSQLCSFANNTPTTIYGIGGIPHIILFAPDGTILSRGLRGDAIKEKLKEVYSK